MSSAPNPRTIEAVQNVEKVRYTTGGGGSVGLGQMHVPVCVPFSIAMI